MKYLIVFGFLFCSLTVSAFEVVSSGNVLRFCLSDRTVYLVKNDNDWSAVTVLPK